MMWFCIKLIFRIFFDFVSALRQAGADRGPLTCCGADDLFMIYDYIFVQRFTCIGNSICPHMLRRRRDYYDASGGGAPAGGWTGS